MSNVIKIRPLRANLFHADGQKDVRTDRHDKTNSRFWQFLRTRLKAGVPSHFVNHISPNYLHLIVTGLMHGNHSETNPTKLASDCQ
jgi:hypothetical protein